MEKGDFLLIELEGKDEGGNVFESTKGEIAKKLYGKEGPLLIILGRTPLLKGIEEEIYKMKEGEEREIIVPPSKGFGFRSKDNVIVVPLSNFDRIPHVNDVVSIESNNSVKVGVVSSISSGRVLIDTNHPLAGRTTYFRIKIVKKLSTEKEKASYLLRENVREFEEKDEGFVVKDKLSEEEKSALKNLLESYSISIPLEFE